METAPFSDWWQITSGDSHRLTGPTVQSLLLKPSAMHCDSTYSGKCTTIYPNAKGRGARPAAPIQSRDIVKIVHWPDGFRQGTASVRNRAGAGATRTERIDSSLRKNLRLAMGDLPFWAARARRSNRRDLCGHYARIGFSPLAF